MRVMLSDINISPCLCGKIRHTDRKIVSTVKPETKGQSLKPQVSGVIFHLFFCLVFYFVLLIQIYNKLLRFPNFLKHFFKKNDKNSLLIMILNKQYTINVLIVNGLSPKSGYFV